MTKESLNSAGDETTSQTDKAGNQIDRLIADPEAYFAAARDARRPHAEEWVRGEIARRQDEGRRNRHRARGRRLLGLLGYGSPDEKSAE